MKFHIAATTLFSTHHASAADVLAGRVRDPTTPAYPLLAGRARRFTSLVTQMHMEVLGALPVEPTAAVFATVHGEIQTAEKLIADFRANALVSGARFALSVHNSPSGVYSVATGSTSPTTTVTGANALAAGWLEAALTAHDRAVLLSIADEPVPAVFRGPDQPVGVAAGFLLGATGRAAELVFATGEVEVNTVQTLARIVDAYTRDAATVIALGSVQPGTTLELHLGAR
ncbi:MAG: beta-ketoacyl synthase chain length factor [Kofleriaceae bacterium]